MKAGAADAHDAGLGARLGRRLGQLMLMMQAGAADAHDAGLGARLGRRLGQLMLMMLALGLALDEGWGS